MIVKNTKTLRDYLSACDAVTVSALSTHHEIIGGLERFHTYIAKDLWPPELQLDPQAALLGFNSLMLWLASIRTSLSGHAAAVFPLLRTALESACYAYLIADDPVLRQIWANRDKDTASRSSCRKEFTSAVRRVASDIDRQQPGGGRWIADAYDEAITFGAHPNIRSVFGHVDIESQKHDWHVSLIGVYSASSIETVRVLVACMDYALAVAVVMTRMLPTPTEDHRRELFKLNELKESLVTPYSREG